ncbi:endopeptidase, partial [Haemophilus influenzae]
MLKRILVIIGLVVLATACSNAPRTVSHQVISENDDIQLTGLINNLEKDNRTGIF